MDVTRSASCVYGERACEEMISNQFAIIMGGVGFGSSNLTAELEKTVEIFDVKNELNLHVDLPELPVGLDSPVAMRSTMGMPLICGGRDEDYEVQSACYILDCDNFKWKIFPQSLREKR